MEVEEEEATASAALLRMREVVEEGSLPVVLRKPRQRPAQYAFSRRHQKLRLLVPAEQISHRAPVEIEPDVLEELTRCKKMSLTCLAKRHRTEKFRRFTNTHILDRFLLECQNYFEVLFDPQLGDAGDELKPEQTVETNRGKVEVQMALNQMARAYGLILFKEGVNYSFLHNEQIFFEALYDFCVRVTTTKFDRKYWNAIRLEIGRVLRSDGYNIADEERHYQSDQHSYIPYRELYVRRTHQKEYGIRLSGTREDRTPLNGMVAVTGQSPVMATAFLKHRIQESVGHVPVPPPPSIRPLPPPKEQRAVATELSTSTLGGQSATSSRGSKTARQGPPAAAFFRQRTVANSQSAREMGLRSPRMHGVDGGASLRKALSARNIAIAHERTGSVTITSTNWTGSSSYAANE